MDAEQGRFPLVESDVEEDWNWTPVHSVSPMDFLAKCPKKKKFLRRRFLPVSSSDEDKQGLSRPGRSGDGNIDDKDKDKFQNPSSQTATSAIMDSEGSTASRRTVPMKIADFVAHQNANKNGGLKRRLKNRRQKGRRCARSPARGHNSRSEKRRRRDTSDESDSELDRRQLQNRKLPKNRAKKSHKRYRRDYSSSSSSFGDTENSISPEKYGHKSRRKEHSRSSRSVSKVKSKRKDQHRQKRRRSTSRSRDRYSNSKGVKGHGLSRGTRESRLDKQIRENLKQRAHHSDVAKERCARRSMSCLPDDIFMRSRQVVREVPQVDHRRKRTSSVDRDMRPMSKKDDVVDSFAEILKAQMWNLVLQQIENMKPFLKEHFDGKQHKSKEPSTRKRERIQHFLSSEFPNPLYTGILGGTATSPEVEVTNGPAASPQPTSPFPGLFDASIFPMSQTSPISPVPITSATQISTPASNGSNASTNTNTKSASEKEAEMDVNERENRPKFFCMSNRSPHSTILILKDKPAPKSSSAQTPKSADRPQSSLADDSKSSTPECPEPELSESIEIQPDAGGKRRSQRLLEKQVVEISLKDVENKPKRSKSTQSTNSTNTNEDQDHDPEVMRKKKKERAAQRAMLVRRSPPKFRASRLKFNTSVGSARVNTVTKFGRVIKHIRDITDDGEYVPRDTAPETCGNKDEIKRARGIEVFKATRAIASNSEVPKRKRRNRKPKSQEPHSAATSTPVPQPQSSLPVQAKPANPIKIAKQGSSPGPAVAEQLSDPKSLKCCQESEERKREKLQKMKEMVKVLSSLPQGPQPHEYKQGQHQPKQGEVRVRVLPPPPLAPRPEFSAPVAPQVQYRTVPNTNANPQFVRDRLSTSGNSNPAVNLVVSPKNPKVIQMQQQILQPSLQSNHTQTTQTKPSAPNINNNVAKKPMGLKKSEDPFYIFKVPVPPQRTKRAKKVDPRKIYGDLCKSVEAKQACPPPSIPQQTKMTQTQPKVPVPAPNQPLSSPSSSPKPPVIIMTNVSPQNQNAFDRLSSQTRSPTPIPFPATTITTTDRREDQEQGVVKSVLQGCYAQFKKDTLCRYRAESLVRKGSNAPLTAAYLEKAFIRIYFKKTKRQVARKMVEKGRKKTEGEQAEGFFLHLAAKLANLYLEMEQKHQPIVINIHDGSESSTDSDTNSEAVNQGQENQEAEGKKIAQGIKDIFYQAQL